LLEVVLQSDKLWVCAKILQDDIDEVIKYVERTLDIQNNPIADLRFHVSKNL